MSENIKELRSLRAEQVEVAEKAIADEKPDEAKDALEEIKKLDTRITKVEEEIGLKDKEDEGDEPKGDNPEFKSQGQEGETRMNQTFKPEINSGTEETRKKEEYVRGLADYIKSKGNTRASVKSDDVGVIIPEAISYIAEHEIKTVQDLSTLVQKTSVKNPSGKHPIVLRATEKFNTVEELKENPELAAPEFKEISWEVNTYRGAIPLSEEAIADSADNLIQLVSNNIQEQKINTLNEKIGTVLKSFAPKTVTGVNGLKQLINVDLDPAYDRQIICSQSFYQQLDTLVDGNGRYLLQDSIINTAGNKVLGMNVTVVRDDLLGEQGEANAFIGDVKRGVFFADRSDVSLSWNQHNIYGRYLMGAFRFDVQQADANAGFFVKADFSKEETPSEA
ncbi:MAG: phage major capsid protein [Staphylococcus equorum]|uniref:phage major capsid protein n=1 Tax=Staphylococcus TaxID=1279 RepID=UPI0025536BAF|nr:phage major capsid protein [Staphylococcus equorum]MDK9870486.1 phage major capsid protein [Staphylococcus equorum]MDK9878284.1 phage major capsid protein [Staphylococcus equorum]MDN6570976.1 phage major capsid protein [Staphylococcus equorum]MDN6610531.1 phage major capsid protein [Staphylococcus equorum]MDN6741286.1 phage major capsid protein [Staphylococcus equorum]